jgi:transposase
MSAPIPALGYPSRTAAALALKGDGLRNSEIADRLGIEKKKVDALLSSVHANRYDRGTRKNQSSAPITITIEHRQKLRSSAAQRGLTVDTLMCLLIERIADDRLVDAILDDKGVLYK